MASTMRKMAVYLGLVEDDRYAGYNDSNYHEAEYDEADYNDYDTREDADRARNGRGTAHGLAAVRDDGGAAVATMSDRRPAGSGQGAGMSATNGTAPAAADLTRITTIHPRTYNDARSIGETFREGVPVIMNVTEMEDADAKRLVDFAAGLVFGLHGTIERVTNKVFLLPANVTVTAEDKARMAETGFFNQS